MIPVRLTLQGIYSYQEAPQTIEFGPLLDAGTFGIFGAVGSGKSTILEAISLALYGEIERLNKRDERNYNMMNLKSDRLYIDLQFHNYEGELFRFECEGRRNSKQFGEVNTYRRKASQWVDNEWQPLDHANAEKITGMSYNNFKRTVIIPQGHFQEFLELTPGARSQMLQDLFSLDRFDLSTATNRLAMQNTESMHRIEGRMTGYENVSVEVLEEIREELAGLKEEASVQSMAVEKLKDQVRESTELKKLFDLSAERISQLNFLHKNEDEIRRKEALLKRYQESRETFSLRLKQSDEMSRALIQQEKALDKLVSQEQKIQISLRENVQKYDSLHQAREQHDALSRKADEYALAGRLVALRRNLDEKSGRIKKGQEVIGKLQKEIGDKEMAVVQLERQIAQNRTHLANRSTLVELKNLFRNQHDIGKQIHRLNERINQTNQKIVDAERQFLEKFHLEAYKDRLNEIPSVLQAHSSKAQKEIETLRQNMHDINVKAEMAQYVRQLSDGVPCPLCGSMDHPAPAPIESPSEERDRIQEKMKVLENRQKDLDGAIAEWRSLSDQRQQRESELEQEALEVSELLKIQETINASLAGYSSQFNTEEDVLKSLRKSDEIGEATIKAEKQLDLLREEVKKNRTDLESYRGKIAQFQSECDQLKGEAQSLESRLSDEIRKGVGDFSEAEWLQRKEDLARKIEKEKADFALVSADRERILAENTRLEAEIKAKTEYLNNEKLEFRQAQDNLKTLLTESGFESLEAVRSLLDLKIEIEQEQERIRTHDREVHVLQAGLKDLKDQIGDRKFDEKVHEESVARLEVSEKELNRVRENTIYKTKKLEENIQLLAEKKKLEAEYAALQIRSENLKVMDGLFRGKGFVDYVSTVYLREICEIANRRFRILTNNQFALVLGDDNQFNVRDYLHDGRIRSVKTLSGGQMFQVSLCLALALAESIQSKSKTNQNFFFLDEGFGTLDGDALRLVMEALKSLRKEGRVVGVISHVESLQDEMDMYLHIHNDPQEGSQIRRSYE